MLWVGFWLKFIVHHIVSYPYLDFIGRFDGSGAQWDQVLLITSIGIMGFNVALFKSAFKPENFLKAIPAPSKNPLSNRQVFAILAGFIALLLTTAFLNLYWGVTLSGITAITVLPFKLNAMSGWFLYMGFALLVALFAKIEFSKYSRIALSIGLAFLESFVCSISLLSRGIYLFHSIPFLYAAILKARSFKITFRHVSLIAVTFCVLFAVNSLLVTSVRYRLYGKEILKVEQYNPEVLLQKNTYENKSNYTFKQIGKLIIDRWIGLEGVMSISTYPERSFELLKTTFFNKLKIGEVDVYAKICLSDYNQTTQYSFTSLPGIISFLYYADNLLLVFIAMMGIGFLLLGIDLLIFHVFQNPFLSAQMGFYLANGVAQFGVSPRPLFISFFMTASFLVFVKLLFTLRKKLSGV